jgi:cytochrome c-type biogenesis protein CcmH/NrfG
LALEPLFELSAFYDAERRTPQARAELVRAVARQPENAAGWQRLGLFDLHHHQPGRALASLQRAHELDQANHQTLVALSQATAAASKS